MKCIKQNYSVKGDILVARILRNYLYNCSLLIEILLIDNDLRIYKSPFS